MFIFTPYTDVCKALYTQYILDCATLTYMVSANNLIFVNWLAGVRRGEKQILCLNLAVSADSYISLFCLWIICIP